MQAVVAAPVQGEYIQPVADGDQDHIPAGILPGKAVGQLRDIAHLETAAVDEGDHGVVSRLLRGHDVEGHQFIGIGIGDRALEFVVIEGIAEELPFIQEGLLLIAVQLAPGGIEDALPAVGLRLAEPGRGCIRDAPIDIGTVQFIALNEAGGGHHRLHGIPLFHFLFAASITVRMPQ